MFYVLSMWVLEVDINTSGIRQHVCLNSVPEMLPVNEPCDHVLDSA